MNNLIKGIEGTIKKAFEEFSSLISDKYDIDPDELQELWNKACSNMPIKVSKKETKPFIPHNM
jgi:hypothetical protein